MKDVCNTEMSLLNIRLGNDVDFECRNKSSSGYNDWAPTIDYAVANALSNGDKPTLGKRCSFVGWEAENDNDMYETSRSLTVEELALDEYNKGRIPADDCLGSGELKGGFVGWHCEGTHIRAIFRILCLRDVLCQSDDVCENIFLTPYQSSPYDLHIGSQSIKPTNILTGGTSMVPAKSFYERRRYEIEAYLNRIATLDPQAICDSLHDAIKHRWQCHNNVNEVLKDEMLQRDMSELRSLSCIAAGLGGKALASIFRCLCFDYRHFCGGLPDLLLIRARFVDETGTSSSLVDLSDWIGESFSEDSIERGCIQEGVSMLRDDEFLGCSKNGDGLTSQRGASNRKVALHEPMSTLPPKLILKHNEKEVAVDTLLVEVKSANDRLDSRQEDWLNVLDFSTLLPPRVCKFDNKKGSK
jgi:hypothetical protein